MSDWTFPRIERLYADIERIACAEFGCMKRPCRIEILTDEQLVHLATQLQTSLREGLGLVLTTYPSRKSDSGDRVIFVSETHSLKDIGCLIAAAFGGMERSEAIMSRISLQKVAMRPGRNGELHAASVAPPETKPQPPSETKPQPLFMTLKAACALVSQSESTLRRMIKAGAIRSIKRGKSRLVETQSLLAYFNGLGRL